MPKRIDHTTRRNDLAKRAAILFSKHGYSGLGMRKIAAELGMSKTALYHYFPTKQALFHACTELVTQQQPPFTHAIDTSPEDSLTTRVHQIIEIIKQMEPNFPAELSLLMDYLRGRAPADIADDPTMVLANQRYQSLVAQFVSEEEARPVLCLLLGTLLMRLFDGGRTDFDEIEIWLTRALTRTATKTATNP